MNHENPTDLFDRKSQMDRHGFHKRSLMQFAGGSQLKSIEGFLIDQCFSIAGPRPITGSWHQLYQAVRDLKKLQYATRIH